MKQKSGSGKAPAEQVLKDIRGQTRRQYSAEEKIRIVPDGLRGRGDFDITGQTYLF
jgi:transposase